MTLLSICQAAADEVQISRPASIVGNTAPDAQRFLRYANKVGDAVMKRHPWQVLRKEREFTGVAGSEQTNILPSDFDRFIPETFWNRSASNLVVGPIDPVRWGGLKSGTYSDTQQFFIYRGSSVFFIPDLAGGESLAFEYVSNQWARSSADAAQTSFLADTDTTVLDDELIILGVIYEWQRSEGQPFDVALADYAGRYELMVGNDQPTSGVLAAGDIFSRGSRHFTGAPRANQTSVRY